MVASVAVPLAISGLQTIYGLAKGIQASKKQIPENKVSPQVMAAYNNAIDMSKYGYTPEEEASFKQNLAQNNNTQYRLSMNALGRSLATAARAGINYGNTNAINTFSANSSNIREQKRRYADTFANQFQRVDDMNTSREYNTYEKEQGAAGGLIHAGIQNAMWGTLYAQQNAGGKTTETTDTGTSAAESVGRGFATGGVQNVTKTPTLIERMQQQLFPQGTPYYLGTDNIYNPIK